MDRHDKYTAQYYWGKYRHAESAWHTGLDMLTEHSKALFVAELLAINKLMDVLRECAEKAEKHAKHEMPHDNARMNTEHNADRPFGTPQ